MLHMLASKCTIHLFTLSKFSICQYCDPCTKAADSPVFYPFKMLACMVIVLSKLAAAVIIASSVLLSQYGSCYRIACPSWYIEVLVHSIRELKQQQMWDCFLCYLHNW